MENLIELNNSGQKISGYINGKDVNLIIHTSEDMFEPDINKPLDNINNYVDLIFQVKIISMDSERFSQIIQDVNERVDGTFSAMEMIYTYSRFQK